MDYKATPVGVVVVGTALEMDAAVVVGIVVTAVGTALEMIAVDSVLVAEEEWVLVVAVVHMEVELSASMLAEHTVERVGQTNCAYDQCPLLQLNACEMRHGSVLA